MLIRECYAESCLSVSCRVTSKALCSYVPFITDPGRTELLGVVYSLPSLCMARVISLALTIYCELSSTQFKISIVNFTQMNMVTNTKGTLGTNTKGILLQPINSMLFCRVIELTYEEKDLSRIMKTINVVFEKV